MSKWIGNKYGRLTIIGNIKLPYGLCKCECGVEKNVNLYDLRRGKIKSCGCLKSELLTESNRTHGLRNHRLYRIWGNMKSRCYNPNIPQAKYYNARNISICEEWKYDFLKFYTWSMENGYSDNLTIDRIDNDQGYNPSNCRWVDLKVQARNRRGNKNFTIKGVTKTLVEWCEEHDIIYQTVQDRLARGWSIEDALSRPLVTTQIGGGK